MRILGFIFLLSAIAGCAGKSGNLVPENQSVIFPKEKASELINGVCYRPPSGITGYWTPQERDLFGVEIDLEEFIEKKLSERNLPSPKRLWSQYRRQATGVLRNDQRLLFISYSRNSPPEVQARAEELRMQQSIRTGHPYDPEEWKKQPIRIMDGGSEVFRVIYDPKKKIFLWYEENGVG